MRVAVVVLLLSAVTLVAGHAVLTAPSAWNPQPSKTSPCGAGKAFTAAAATYSAGQTITLTWKVIAGDGTGPVTVSIDQAGGTNFVTVATATTSITTTGTFSLSITLPTPLACTAANGLCTLQAKSSSGWYSCTSFALPGASPVASSTGAAGPTCTTAPTLKFCTQVSGKSIDYSANPQLDADSIADWDATVNSTYVQNIGSKLVFTHQHNDACLAGYKAFLCASEFPLCGTVSSGTCASSCAQVDTLCGVNATHAALFVCPGVNIRTTSDSWGTCASLSSSGSSQAGSTGQIGAAISSASPITLGVAFVLAAVAILLRAE